MNYLDLSKRRWQWLILLFLAFIWGSSFILMKKGLNVYSHDNVAALRITISFLFLFPYAITYLKKIEKKYWKYLILSGFLGNGIPSFLFTKAQTEISSSLSGMLNSLTPLFVVIIGILIFKTKIIKHQIVGVAIGLIGASCLICEKGISLENSNFSYTFYVVLATICYAFSTNIIKLHLKEVPPIAITALAFFCIGPLTIAYLFTTDFIETSITNPNALNAFLYISILAIVGTALAVILFNLLIKKASVLTAASVTYLIPIVAIFWGFFDGEIISRMQLACIVIILIGIYFINKR